MRKALDDFDEESHATLLLPDVSVAMLSSMLKCTLNPAVRNDTLSVNELQIMQLLGFPVLPVSPQDSQREMESGQLQTENNKTSNSELNLAFCMQESYEVNDLNEDLEENIDVDNQRGPSILSHHDDEDNLDNISLLSSTLSISDVSRVICMKNTDSVPDKKEALSQEVPIKCSLEGATGIVLPPPQEYSQPTTGTNPGSSLSAEHITVDKQRDNCVKSAIEKYFDRESVINTPTLPNLTCEEHEDELVNLVTTFPLSTEEPILAKKSESSMETENILPVTSTPTTDDCSDIVENKTLSTQEQMSELGSTISSCRKVEWLCEESSKICDKESTSHFIDNKQSSSNVFHLEPPKAKLFECPSPNCKLRFQRLLHYERHVGSCIAKSGKVFSKGDYECEKCGKAFHHPDNLKLHEKYHADLLIEKECNICGMKKIMGRHALTAHMERFHATKASCPFCRKVLSSRRLLNRHISRVHQNKKGKVLFQI